MAHVNKRNAIKNSIIRVNKFVKSPEFVTSNKSTITTKLDSVKDYWQQYLETHYEIIDICGDKELPFQETEMTAAECIFETTKSCLLNKLQEFDVVTHNVGGPSNVVDGQVTIAAPLPRVDIHLPRIELPRYTGNFTEWLSYHDQFKGLICDNVRLTNAQRMHYLKASLDGEAAQLIRSFAVTDANFSLAWQSLKDRYHCTRRMVNSHIKSFYTQPRVQTESSTHLRRLIDSANECIRALKDLKIIADEDNSCETFIVFVVSQKLDETTARDWEESLTQNQMPTLKDFTAFIEQRCRALETVTIDKPKFSKHEKGNSKNISRIVVGHAATTSNTANCATCNTPHLLRDCPKFHEMNYNDRIELVRQLALCYNCMKGNHSSRNCNSGRCRKCTRKHHTLLHPPTQPSTSSSSSNNHQILPSTSSSIGTTSIDVTAQHLDTNTQVTNHGTVIAQNSHLYGSSVLLATARILVQGIDGTLHLARALLDTGSQASFITEDFVQFLKLPRTTLSVKVKGLGSVDTGNCNGMVTLRMTSRLNRNQIFTSNALVLNKITTYTPSSLFKIPTELIDLQLADPFYDQGGKIDILIGSDIYGHVIEEGLIRFNGTLIAQNTVFGWVLSGSSSGHQRQLPHVDTTNLHVTLELNQTLKSFWEIEDVSIGTAVLTKEERACISHFNKTHKRDSFGRFMVELPFKECADTLGNSRKSALVRFLQLERKFGKDMEFKKSYVEFMNDYRDLGHMELACSDNIPDNQGFYIPHHAIFKPDSSTSKIRVVFDASNKSSTGSSLNDLLLVGPKLQEDLFSILLRFRKHAIAFTADIKQMYRQIQLASHHKDFHRILWRSNAHEVLAEYCLSTVTYGTASAPYLAVQCLQQCAIDDYEKFPLAADTVKSDCYVDDLITGADDEDKALELQQNINQLLSRGGFQLRKWASNSTNILRNIAINDRDHAHGLSFGTDEPIKALGIWWYPNKDYFGFKVNFPAISTNQTKRSVLADISRLFDPLGLLSPIVIMAKIYMQRLWVLGLDWDEPIPQNELELWLSLRNQLPSLELIEINRWLGTYSNEPVEVHGFSDASEAAFSAVVYARIFNKLSGKYEVALISSKTKVAPLKKVTLARLELCGAVLLSRLIHSIMQSLRFKSVSYFGWSDSTTVLSWLRKSPHAWPTFIANRVSQIQDVLEPSRWKYVPSAENPADVASRGALPDELREHNLWWHGPQWLLLSSEHWPQTPPGSHLQDESPALHTTTLILTTTLDLVNRFSSLINLKRVTAYILRFNNNCKTKQPDRLTGNLSTNELQNAFHRLILISQRIEYAEDFKVIQHGSALCGRSALIRLAPFVDAFGLLRVGGRIDAANLPYNIRHPIILPTKSHLTSLIITDSHAALLHGGAQLMLTHLRRNFWLPRARSIIKNFIYKCIPCFRQRKTTAQQIMADLPQLRLTPSKPFATTGVDYAGPITLRLSKIRNAKTSKGYIALFVCMVTRAIHLELVSDLTTSAFLAAFRRFVARRGSCTKMLSDNGTNFVGAHRELKELYAILRSEKLENALVNNGTSWQFIPPSAPHHGGIWERGVRSVKQHLRRVVGTTHLTFEELATVLAEIESCLNSRPLAPISDDPQDLTALTPGHFLVGEPLVTIPSQDFSTKNVSRLDRWQLVQKTTQDFWSRWYKEYISGLQQRHRWTKEHENIKCGQLVLVKDDRLPPSQWLLARVVQEHPDKKGKVRVVTIKHQGGETTRPIQKLCPLPIEADEDNCNK